MAYIPARTGIMGSLMKDLLSLHSYLVEGNMPIELAEHITFCIVGTVRWAPKIFVRSDGGRLSHLLLETMRALELPEDEFKGDELQLLSGLLRGCVTRARFFENLSKFKSDHILDLGLMLYGLKAGPSAKTSDAEMALFKAIQSYREARHYWDKVSLVNILDLRNYREGQNVTRMKSYGSSLYINLTAEQQAYLYFFVGPSGTKQLTNKEVIEIFGQNSKITAENLKKQGFEQVVEAYYYQHDGFLDAPEHNMHVTVYH